MSALIPAFARSRGRVDPAVFGHVIRLVQHDYMASSSSTTRLSSSLRSLHPSRPPQELYRSNTKTTPRTIGESSSSRLRHYSASAQAVQHEHEHEDPPPTYTPPTFFPTAPRSPPPRRGDATNPPWAHLNPSLSTSLSQGSFTSPAHFRIEFDNLDCKSGQLASLDTLQQVFSLFLSAPEPSQWAWLSGQLGHILAAVSDAGGFHPDVPALGNSIRAYCLAELGQAEEARGLLHGAMMARRSTLAVDHSVMALTLLRIGEQRTAREQMVKAIRRGITATGKGRYLTSTLADCFALYARQVADGDMLHILQHGGHGLRQLLTSAMERRRNPEFVSVWTRWLAAAPVSLSLTDNSSQGDFLRHLHVSALVRDKNRAVDAHRLFTDIYDRGRSDDLHPSLIKRLAQVLRDQGHVDKAESISASSSHAASERRQQRQSPLRAALAAKDAQAVEDYLADRMQSSRPDSHEINEVLELMSTLDEPTRARRVFALFDQVGITPDLRAFTTMIGIHARHRELDDAEALFEALLNTGIEPDAVAWSTIMNAHAESGDWDGLAQRWAGLDDELRQSPDIVSILMKAMVLKGAATSTVLATFQELEEPTNHHWALVLQSTADNGDLNLMKRLFGEMQARSAESDKAPKPDVYTYSILLHAYLRTNNSDRSREIYDEMLQNNVVPSSVTYSMIISSYGKGPNRGGFQRAEDFAMSIYRLSRVGGQSPVDAGLRLPKGRTNENLLSPLVVAAGRANDPRLASRYFDLIAQDAEPSIPVFTRYLDVWRRAGETSMVMRVWAEIFALACRTISVSPTLPSRSRPQRQPDNVLVIPLTIVLITLGRDKRLLDLRRIWDEVRSAGFGFDAANFNQLAISLARSGDVEGAFDIVENVFAQPAEQELAEQDHMMGVQPVLDTDVSHTIASSTDSTVHMEGSMTAAMLRPSHRRLEAIAATTSSPPPTTIPEQLSTPSHEKIWRPHFRTMATLDSVISQLENQQDRRAWLGLGSTEEAEGENDIDAESGESVVDLPEFGTCVRDPVDGQPKKTSARGLLMKLNRKYSKAMALVMFHRRKQSGKRPMSGSSRR